MTPYYADDSVTLYHGDCREILPSLGADILVTDPPYPNNAGWFDADVTHAADLLAAGSWREAIILWSELEQPPCKLPAVAVHIWHRTNVNGRPYEPAYQFATDGRKRRSEVMAYPAIFNGAGPGCREYLGHPTQKPAVIMRRLIEKTGPGLIVDPFAGSGSTLAAAKFAGRRAIGVEVNERYCEIAARRLAQDVLAFDGAAS